MGLQLDGQMWGDYWLCPLDGQMHAGYWSYPLYGHICMLTTGYALCMDRCMLTTGYVVCMDRCMLTTGYVLFMDRCMLTTDYAVCMDRCMLTTGYGFCWLGVKHQVTYLLMPCVRLWWACSWMARWSSQTLSLTKRKSASVTASAPSPRSSHHPWCTMHSTRWVCACAYECVCFSVMASVYQRMFMLLFVMCG